MIKAALFAASEAARMRDESDVGRERPPLPPPGGGPGPLRRGSLTPHLVRTKVTARRAKRDSRLRAEARSDEMRVVACPEDLPHAQQLAVSGARIGRFSRLTSDVEGPMLRTDLRGRFASVLREAGSEDCFSTLRRNVPRARSQVVARIHLLNPHCSGSQLSPRSTSAAITSLILAPASPSSRLSLRSTRSARCRP